MKDFTTTIECRLCRSYLNKPIISFGSTPLANELVEDNTKEVDLFPLELCVCNSCGLVQMSGAVNPSRLFENYLFVSGTSPASVSYLKTYVEDIIKKFDLKPTDFIVEVASNDGSFLKIFKDLGFNNVLGVDPAKNIAKIANDNGIKTICEFFTLDTAKKIVKEFGHAKAVIMNNALAHNSTVQTIVDGMKYLIGKDGYIVIEHAYLKDIIEKKLLGLFYSEHECTFALNNLNKFFHNNGLQVFDALNTTPHEGSIRLYIGNYGVSYPYSNNLAKMLRYEYDNEFQPNPSKKLIQFKEDIENIGKNIKNKLYELKEQNKKIAIVGCPAKLTTELYVFDIPGDTFEFACDDNELKQNKYIPGKNIKILNTEEIYKNNIDVVYLGAWNFAKNIIHTNRKFVDDGGVFIVPLPALKEINKDNIDEYLK